MVSQEIMFAEKHGSPRESSCLRDVSSPLPLLAILADSYPKRHLKSNERFFTLGPWGSPFISLKQNAY